MKALTESEYEAAPGIIQACYIAAMHNEPIAPVVYNRAIEEYPEYFPDEIERREIWANIPVEVKQQYDKELAVYKLDLMNKAPAEVTNEYDRIMLHKKNPKLYKKYKEFYKRSEKLIKEKEDELFTKHFSSFYEGGKKDSDEE